MISGRLYPTMQEVENRKAYKTQATPYIQKISEMNPLIYDLKTELLKTSLDHFETRLDLTIRLNEFLLKDSCYHVMVSRLSQAFLDLKAGHHLEQARKNCYLIVQYYEEIVGRHVDSPPLEQSSILSFVNKRMSNLERFNWFRKLGFLIDRLDLMYEDNSKWKWSFVDLSGRFIAVVKNYLDLREMIKGLEPSFAYYAEYRDMFSLMVNCLDEITERYRNKYEHTNKNVDDMRKALQFIAFHRRLCNLVGNNEKSGLLKKQHQTWSKKLEEDMEKQEKSQ